MEAFEQGLFFLQRLEVLVGLDLLDLHPFQFGEQRGRVFKLGELLILGSLPGKRLDLGLGHGDLGLEDASLERVFLSLVQLQPQARRFDLLGQRHLVRRLGLGQAADDKQHL